MRGFQPNTKSRTQRSNKKLRIASSATTSLSVITTQSRTGPRSLKKEKQLARAEAHTKREAAAAVAAAAAAAPAVAKKAAMRVD